MTDLRIDLAKFKAACIAKREEIASTMEICNWTTEEFAAQTCSEKKDWYEFTKDQFSVIPLWMRQIPARNQTADDLRAELNIAARAMQQYGATKAQIDYIVALAVKKNDFNVLGSAGRLSRAEARRIIESMK